VTVVPLARADAVLDAAQQRLAYEEEVLGKLNSDQDVGALFPSPEIEYIS
jgi:regulator of RNase E activity RraA